MVRHWSPIFCRLVQQKHPDFLYFHPIQQKHDAEEAHLYVRGKPPTAVASEEPLPISLYSLY